MKFRKEGTIIKVQLNGEAHWLPAERGNVYTAILEDEQEYGILARLVDTDALILVDHECRCSHLSEGEWNEVKE